MVLVPLAGLALAGAVWAGSVWLDDGPPPPPPRPAVPVVLTAADAPRLYARYGCLGCHGAAGDGNFPLTKSREHFPTDAALAAFILDARATKPDTTMPTWAHVISDAELAVLVAHVRSLDAPPAAVGNPAATP